MAPIPDDMFDPALDTEVEELFCGIGDSRKFGGLDFPHPEPGDPDQREQLSADEYREKFGSESPWK